MSQRSHPHPTLYHETLTHTGITFPMIYVEGATFERGSKRGSRNEKHQVSLSPFYIGQYPVTQALWQAVMGNNPARFKGGQRPVEQVSWEDTQDFLQKLSALALRSYRLPTEAEWEYAARGGRQSRNYEYAGSNELEEVGWYYENSHRESKYVGQKFPNELGLYDMSGNVREWCEDYYSNSYYASCARKGVVENPTGPATGTNRVFRGGGWGYDARICRSTVRDHGDPEGGSGGLGFRLVFSL